MMKILKQFGAAIAAWKVIALKTKLETGPTKEDVLLLSLLATKTTSLFEAQERVNGVLKDLWLHFTEDHGGFWDKQKIYYDCYAHEQHSILKEHLWFWIRNVQLLEKNSPPMTNPLWLINKDGVIVRLQANFISGPDFLERGIEIIISSITNSIFEAIEKHITIANNRVFAWFYTDRQWRLIEPTPELERASETWPKQSISYKEKPLALPD